MCSFCPQLCNPLPAVETFIRNSQGKLHLESGARDTVTSNLSSSGGIRLSGQSTWTHFSVFRRVRKFRKTTVSFVVSVRTEQLGFHWVVFHEIWNFRIFRKYAEEIQVSLESGTNMGYFTWIPMCLYDNMPLNSSWTGKYFIPSLLRKSKYKFYVP